MKEEIADQLAHTLLIELLSFQFASPVKWIETQDIFINDYKIENFIEIGPQPILANMMKRTCLAKIDSMNLGNQKSVVNTYCVSDIESIPYYQEKKIVKTTEIKVHNDLKTSNEVFLNPYKNQINLNAVEDTRDMSSYNEFVVAEALNKVEKKTKYITEEDIEKEKLRFEQYKQELQSSSLTSTLLHEYNKVATNIKESVVVPKQNSLNFELSKIREYDNPHAWIRSLTYKIATSSSLNIELYSSIVRLLNVYTLTIGIKEEIEHILEYNGKNIDMLKMYVHVYQKEQSLQLDDVEDRCDSGMTLYDGESSGNEDIFVEPPVLNKNIVFDWNKKTGQFNQDYKYVFDNNDSTLKHNFKQCDVVFISETNVENNFWKFAEKYFEQENACLFVAANCKSLKTFYYLSEKLQQYYLKHCTMSGKLYVLPYSKTQKDHTSIINCVYTHYNYDIDHILLYDDNTHLDSLSEYVSTAKSNLPYITPKTKIISSFVSNLKFIDTSKTKNTEQIQFEALDHRFIDFEELFNLNRSCKIVFSKDYQSDIELDSNILFSNFDKIITPSVNIQSLSKPNYKSYQKLQAEFNGVQLQNFLDPKNLVVITGFSEIGPLGNAITRWDFEKNNETFSTESLLYLCLIMNILKYDSKTGKYYDVAKNEEIEIKEIIKYEKYVLAHTGIRILEEDVVDYNPGKKPMLQEVVLLQSFKTVVSEELMKEYKLMHDDDSMKITALNQDNMFEVKFLPGTKLYLPKAFKFDRYVSGQIPLGWDASNYGISQDIINQVDRLTLFALITTVEALCTSGIIDPYELYEYMDISKVGNCSGSGIGGLKSHQKMQKSRYVNKTVQNDIIQETFINSMSAWINMLILSSAGPLKTPVGACATALESLDLGYEVIMSGKANVVLVGGYDDLTEETSYEFANMGATANAKLEKEQYGRLPKEICRPMTKTRNGFTESQGSGMQVLVRGDIALKMGLPCFGIVNYTSINSDKISKSLPAPGKGVLTTARKTKTKFKQRKLDIDYRKQQVSKLTENDDYTKRYWQVEYSKNDPKISPIEGSLSVFGLNINDIGVSSCHGTSTKANDKNETNIINTIMETHERSKGNLLPIVCQKAITGHPKAAAGAWMLNGLLQMFEDDIIPGNVRADNVDENITKNNEYLLINKTNIHLKSSIKAGMLTSFGFGQKGALSMILNPNYLLACLTEDQYLEYMEKFENRYQKANYEYGYRMLHRTLFQEKTAGPYGDKPIEEVYLGI